ncbi:hypothetical protein [Mycolicibacterium komossense]|uniref:Uncharacterized protein n=1 Tax=Mycolicibacterium komossense TaxID=1779 RepID=A0ABT3CMK1_9MYCO|nr:hypothetical protein [Mycolicibacterium komossense]MCV7230690.1 hypothetical protein [Mycolicibacterium komossense]
MSGEVLVRAWEPNLIDEGARLKATLVRRDITFQARTGDFDVEQITMPGLAVIAESAGPRSQNAIDVCVSAIPSQIKFTILSTDELIWMPIAAHRDTFNHWHLECVPFADWLRLKLRNEPELRGTPNGR